MKNEKQKNRSEIQNTIFKKKEGLEIISVKVKLKDKDGKICERDVTSGFEDDVSNNSRLIYMTESQFQETSQRIYENSNLAQSATCSPYFTKFDWD